MERIKDEQRWFVYDYYDPAGRPKLEAMLIDYAKKKYLYCLIDEGVLTEVVNDISEEQERLGALNKRLKKVKIDLSKVVAFRDTKTRNIWIGDCNLRMRMVNEVFQEI